MGGDCRAGVLLKVRNASVQSQKFLCSPWIFEADLATFLLSSGAMRLLNQIVAARRCDDLNVLHAVQHRKFPNGRSVAPEFIRVDHVWHVVIH